MKKVISLSMCSMVMYVTYVLGVASASSVIIPTEKIEDVMDKGLTVVVDGKSIIDNAQYYEVKR